MYRQLFLLLSVHDKANSPVQVLFTWMEPYPEEAIIIPGPRFTIHF